MSITIQTGSNGGATLAAIPSFAMRMSALGYGGLTSSRRISAHALISAVLGGSHNLAINGDNRP